MCSQRMKIDQKLLSTCSFFLPRLLFINSEIAPRICWGDIVSALSKFNTTELDLASENFWQEWMIRWSIIGDEYAKLADSLYYNDSKAMVYRSASACYHWAEFMYFSDSKIKNELRYNTRHYFLKSLDAESDKTKYTYDIVDIADHKIPIFLFFPHDKCITTTSKKPYPCVLLSNGLDSMTEIEILSLAEPYLKMGIAVCLFDGPGQGINLGRYPIEKEFDRTVSGVLSYLSHNSNIDSSQLGFIGISFGGYLALKVAQSIGEQFKFIINISGGPTINKFEQLPRRLKEDFKFAFMLNDDSKMKKTIEQLTLDINLPPKTSVLSIHGHLDDIFPFEQVKLLDNAWKKNHTLIDYKQESHVCFNKINQYIPLLIDWIGHHFPLEKTRG